MNISFQINYLFAFNIINDMAKSPPELIRLAAMVRANESAAQGISYGLSSITSLLTVGISAIGFGVWGISLIPSRKRFVATYQKAFQEKFQRKKRR